MKTVNIEEPIEGFTHATCTVKDLIAAYGTDAITGKKSTFCVDCAEYKTCQGKLDNCPEQEYYIENELNGKVKNEVRTNYRWWSKWEDEEIIRLYNQGVSDKDIAEKLDRRRHSINDRIRRLRKQGYDIKKKLNWVDWTKYDNRIIALREEGKYVKDIAKIIGIPKGTISEHITTLRKKGVMK